MYEQCITRFDGHNDTYQSYGLPWELKIVEVKVALFLFPLQCVVVPYYVLIWLTGKCLSLVVVLLHSM